MKIDWIKLAVERAKSGHALFGPSSYPRLFRCPASFRLSILHNAVSRSTQAAILGTCAHDLAERSLKEENDPWMYVGETFTIRANGQDIEYIPDDEMAKYVGQYVDWCRECRGDYFVEERYELSKVIGIPYQFGTGDFTAIYDKTLEQLDLKYGEGVWVYAEENEQGLGYALGAYLKYRHIYPNIKNIIIKIAQPRLNNFDTFECDIEYLIEFGRRLRKQVKLAMQEDTVAVAGEKQCRFCPMSGNCTVENAAKDRILLGDLGAFTGTAAVPERFTPEQFKFVIENRDFVRNWLNRTEGAAINCASRQPGAIKGWKIVESATHRKFKDEKAVVDLLRNELLMNDDDIYSKSLRSPKQFEDMLKGDKVLLEDYIYRPRGKATLAKESDKRVAYNPLEEDLDEFDAFSDEEF